MKLPTIPVKYSTRLLRILMGVIFVTHGTARLYYNSVSDFGGFLNSKGLVIGVFLAWLVTVGEMISGTLLAIGYKIKCLVLFHAVVIAMGIFLVHLPNGWLQ